MKKLLLSGLALTVCFATFAQNRVATQAPIKSTTANKIVSMHKPADGPIAPFKTSNTVVSQHRNSFIEQILGTTVYDLQSNYGSVGNRVKLWDDGTISAVWTKGDADPTFSDRGTGYNYYDGTGWLPAPTARIETYRTGWPNVSGTAMSGEYVVNHGTNPTNLISRAVKGTGPWNEAALDTTTMTWPRMVVGGANGTSIHVIGSRNAGDFYMLYSRSLDGGATWADENVVLPGMSTDFYEASIDGYDIDARGDVIAIVMGGFANDLTMWKSMDNGATWTQTTINTFPLSPFDYTTQITDVDGDAVADTIWTTDSGMSIVIDNNNMCHVAVGLMRVYSDTPNPDGTSYFPGTDGLLYWNENMPTGDITNNIIAAIEDIDGSGDIEIPAGLALYQCSLTGMPTLGVDASNNIHLAYSSIIENTTNGNANPDLEEAFRNVYYMYSTDAATGGTPTWATPMRVEPSDFDEQAWPCMAKKVDSGIHLTYHKDGEPGNTFQPSESPAGTEVPDPYGPYDVIYNRIQNPVGLNENNAILANVSIYPNPVSSVLNVDYTLTQTQKYSVELVNVLGQSVYTNTLTGTAGINNLRIPVKNYSAGVYSLNVYSGNNVATQKVVIR
jgi:hypothetical protein